MDKITERDMRDKLKLSQVPGEAKTFKGVWASMKADPNDGIAYLTLTQTHRPYPDGCNCDPEDRCHHENTEIDQAIRAMEKAGWEIETILNIRKDTEAAQLMREDVLQEQCKLLVDKDKRRRRLGTIKR